MTTRPESGGGDVPKYDECRPVGEAASRKDFVGEASLAETADLAHRAARHDHAVRVLFERADGVVASQLFTSLPAAEKKLRRTRERGLFADLHLVRLLPVRRHELRDEAGGLP